MKSVNSDFLKDAIDCHVHTSPGLFERRGDVQDLSRECQKYKMAGAVVKHHHGDSAPLVEALKKKQSTFKLYGGVVLNNYVGGLNPAAVESSIKLGGRFVWCPTIHAKTHLETFKVSGGFDSKVIPVKHGANQPITVLDKKNELCFEMQEILELLHKSDIILASGHLSFYEIKSITDWIKKEEKEIKFLINHSFFPTVNLDRDDIEILKSPSTWFEISALTFRSFVAEEKFDSMSKILKEYQNVNWIMASDSGKREAPSSPEALLKFSEALINKGVSELSIKKMLKDNPKALLSN